jgi:hypothetical protein
LEGKVVDVVVIYLKQTNNRKGSFVSMSREHLFMGNAKDGLDSRNVLACGSPRDYASIAKEKIRNKVLSGDGVLPIAMQIETWRKTSI